MGRILALDYGLKRTGIAVSDPLQIIASPLDTISTQALKTWLADYLAQEEVETLVVGLPFNDDGEDTDSTPHIRGFIKRVKKDFPNLPIETIDESFSSRDASQAMIAGGMKKKKRREKGTVDRIAATLILQSYMAQKT